MELSQGQMQLVAGASGFGGFLTIHTNGTERMRLDASGNVGIGTTSPATKLEVMYGTNGYATINNTTDSNTGIKVMNTGRAYGIFVDGGSGASNGLRFYDFTAGSDRIKLDSSGNVGIGTTSPGDKLDVAGDIRITNAGSNELFFTDNGQIRSNDDNHRILFRRTENIIEIREYGSIILSAGATSGTATNSVFVQSGGNVGIGTTSPSYKLDITGDARVNTGALGVNVAPNATDGRIDAANDIVAFSSDRRLKTNIENITDALGKIQSLSGFTYNWNDVANKVAGFDTTSRYVGVYAQDVQAVLPEAIKLAPFDNNGHDVSISGENYLTVQYEKLVPLLIEAIKELKKEVDELKKGKTE